MNEDQPASISNWIREQVANAGAQGTVFGLSGGIDSAVTAALCKMATGADSLGLIMPCHSCGEDIQHAILVAETLGIRTLTIDVGPIFDGLRGILPPGTQLAYANLKPRLRMMVLYYFANLNHYLVVGTGNRSEPSVGYFTKPGDGGVDILPLGALLKREVRTLASMMGIPRVVIEKAPSAGLWAGQTDEMEMGLSYEELDDYLSEAQEKELVNPNTAARIAEMMTQSAHKRSPILIYRKPDKPASATGGNAAAEE